ncbi:MULTISPECIES: glycosyltransferase family 2 protein [Agrobacterium]|uniref:Glycosyltransferase family 2 protein n=1 Tax=Agrobacterium tumefaciens TaxID=358 RepID=A0AAE6EGA1_AGRTU|nr:MULTISPECIES: glycosyltransferase family 2 protein [Agrobacterium]QCL75022.1 glycosyltransferase family 2 protein [Agrobacterium tumefaciens]QCL80582.1 glycosyltransferase family 2 protein [Agrobacterium tumefaciens]CUX63290.1 putative glycosyltransferases [Agrobacterium sp. NCPPB 925]
MIDRPQLSVVATLYRSAAGLGEFHDRVTAAARALAGDSYEIVLVNDGSPDDSLDLALAAADADSHIVVVDLSRNFGHHKAMMTGLDHARGEKIFLIDSDLEEDPAWLTDFDRTMQSAQSDVVYGVQTHRKGGVFEQWSGEAFYGMFNWSTGLDLPRNLVTARLMTRRYVDALLLHREREIFLAGLWQITGFTQTPVEVAKLSLSATSYSFRRKLGIFVDSITSFTNAPLVFIFHVGVTISFLALAYILWLVINRLFLSMPQSGWTSVVASIWLVGGLNILFLGVIGIYLSKIFTETKRRPYTIVRRVYGRVEK